MNIISIINEADLVGKIVFIVLFAFSVYSWGIIIGKGLALMHIHKTTSESLELLERGERWVKTGILKELIAIYQQFTDNRQKASAAMETHWKIKYLKLSSSLTSLAIISSTAPFIGLFGTVWGIIKTFQAISGSKAVSLAVVAPGLSESLFATAAGIAVALPAYVFYNLFNDKYESLSHKINAGILLIQACLWDEKED